MIIKVIKNKNINKKNKLVINNLINECFPKIENYEIYDETLFYLFLDKESNIKVLEKDNIIGIINILDNKILTKKKTEDELFGYSIKGELGYYLYNFLVNNKYRNKGYGKKIIKYLILNLKKNNISDKKYYKYIHTISISDISSNIFKNLGFHPENNLIDKNNNYIKIYSKWLN